MICKTFEIELNSISEAPALWIVASYYVLRRVEFGNVQLLWNNIRLRKNSRGSCEKKHWKLLAKFRVG